MRDSTVKLVSLFRRCVRRRLAKTDDLVIRSVLAMALNDITPSATPKTVETVCRVMEDVAVSTDDDDVGDCFLCMSELLTDVFFDLECDNEF